jgi:phage shock protein A
MGLFDRLSRVIRANMNDLVSKAEDPEKLLEQALIDMQEDLIQLRQAVASTIATQKRTEQQYQKNLQSAEQWQQRAQLALSKGDENLARQALTQKKTYADTATALKIQLDQQVTQVETLKRNLIALESKISEAKTKKDMLKARAQAAKANQQLSEAMTNIGTSSAMAAFERMEEKVMQIEAQSQAAAEIGGTGIESQWAQLEGGSAVDDELAMLKLQMAGGSPNQPVLTGQVQDSIPQNTAQTAPKSAIDDELEALRRELNK